MTYLSIRGPENVLEAIRLAFYTYFNGRVATMNAATYALMIAQLKGPYTLAGQKISTTWSGGSAEVTTTLPSGSYTAAALETWWNANRTSNQCYGKAVGDYFSLKGTAGTDAYIKIGSDTGRSIFGWQEGQVENYQALNNIAYVAMSFENDPAFIPAFPAVQLWCVENSCDADRWMQGYRLNARLVDTCPDPTLGNVIYRNLMRYAELVRDMINTDSYIYEGHANRIFVDSIRPNNSIMIDAADVFKAYIDISITALVQEE